MKTATKHITPAHFAASAASRRGRSTDRATLDELRRLLAVLGEHDWSDRRAFNRASKQARNHALAVLERDGYGIEHRRAALLIAAADTLGSLRGEIAGSVYEVARLGERLEEDFGISRAALARELMRAPELLTMQPSVAIAAHLATLAALAPLRGVSLWVLDESGRVSCVLHVGDGGPSRGASALAEQVLAGTMAEPSPRRLLLGRAVGRWQPPLGALVGSARPGLPNACETFLDEAVPMLGAILERETLLAVNAESERALVESSERKLTRLGYDLHDGPIQDVAIIAADLRQFWGQLEGELGEVLAGRSREGTLIRGRMEDLDAQLAGLDGELRRISNEVRAASVLLNRPFAIALRDVGRAFASRTEIEPRISVDGDLSAMTASQQIALLNIVHEALTNVREHSRATEVEISVSARPDGVSASVRDNGCGFDLEPTLMRAAGQGRLGLVGMHERVRLLGGRLQLDSHAGGPTVISVDLQRWEPIQQEAPGARRSA